MPWRYKESYEVVVRDKVSFQAKGSVDLDEDSFYSPYAKLC